MTLLLEPGVTLLLDPPAIIGMVEPEHPRRRRRPTGGEHPLGQSEVACFPMIATHCSRKLSHHDQSILACAVAEHAQFVTDDVRQADASPGKALRLARINHLGLVLHSAVFVGT